MVPCHLYCIAFKALCHLPFAGISHKQFEEHLRESLRAYSYAGYWINIRIDTSPAAVFPDSAITWVHDSNVAEAIIRALEKPDNIGENYLAVKFPSPISAFIRECILFAFICGSQKK
jgi:hypothetical protein